MKKIIRLTTLENQTDILTEYSSSLSPSERLEYLQQLNRVAFPDAYEHGKPKPLKKVVKIIKSSAG